jgi:hypothetical protein
MSYIGTEPKDIRSFGRTKFDYTATQGQTAFTGADDDGKVLAFTVGQIEVYVNGILMDDSDFTTTGTGTVTLATAANLNDVVNVVSFETNIPDSNYVPASGGTFTGNITASGTLGVTGAVTASNGLTVDDDSATPLTVDRATNDGTVIDVQKNGASVGTIGTAGNQSYIHGAGTDVGLYWGSNNLYPYRSTGLNDATIDIGQSGKRFKDLYLSGGAYIGGIAAANKLDDYEEGEHEVTLVPSGSGTISVSGSNNDISYTKIGNRVHVSGQVLATSSSSPVGYIKMSLPFPIKNSGTANTQKRVTGRVNIRHTSLSTNQYTLLGVETESLIRIYRADGTDVLSTSANQFASMPGTGISVIVNFTYPTDS